jgi:hypothetical protein
MFARMLLITTGLSALFLTACSSSTPATTADNATPPPKIQAWMNRLTVAHEYDPKTGFIVARETVPLPAALTQRSIDAAIAQARADQLVIAFATADRCAPCQQFKHDALNDPVVLARLAEPRVTPAHVAALDDLDWMLGTWQADVADRATIEITYEKALGGYCIVGKTKIMPKPGKATLLPNGIEALEVIHADRDAGLIRAWVFDSTGAKAEGFFEFDGTSFEKVMSGTPSDAVRGRRANWVQVIAPGGDGKVTTHMIERTIDGVGLPDARPLTFKKIR